MKRIILIFLTSLFMNGLQAQTSPKFITTVEGISEYQLPNGLKILLIPDPGQTNVVVNIVYLVGSKHEGYGEKGMAHLLEHMLFKQSGRFTDIKKAISDKGALANGTTYYDRTNFYEVLPGTDENLRWALDMEADRMVNSKILQEELNKEFSVVRNEFEMGENDPFGMLFKRVVSSMYLWHNYGKSTIGSKEDIERVKASSLKSFYKKYYQPDNAVLVIAGKFDQKKALSYVHQYFSPIQRPARILEPTYTKEPVQEGQRTVELRRVGDVQYFIMAYHTPSFADEDCAANLVLIEMLVNNPSGLFYKNLVETKLATQVEGGAERLHDPGFTFFYAKVPMGNDINKAKERYLSSADSIAELKISEEDLNRAKNVWINFIHKYENNTQDFAIHLTEYIAAGDWKLWFLNRDRVENLKVSDLERVAKKYYKKSNRTYGLFIPDNSLDRTIVNETPDIAKLLAGYKGREVKTALGSFENSIANIKGHTIYGTLSNGAKYALLGKPVKADKISAVIQLRFGDENSLSNKNQIGPLLAQMLKTGTTKRTNQQISDELNRIKTEITFTDLSSGILLVQLNTDKANLSDALNLLTDLLKNPKFDIVEFDKLVLRTKTNYESERQDPQSIANQTIFRITSQYPKGHPLYSADTQENLDDLGKVTLNDLKKYYDDFYGANHSISAFVGGIDKETVNSFLNNVFAKWNSKSDYTRIKPQYFEMDSATKIIKTPDKANAVMFGKVNLALSQQNPDYPAAYMANELLGGGTFLSSRIPQRLREKEGMSYGAASTLISSFDVNHGSWLLYAIFNPMVKDKLNAVLIEEIDKAIKDGFTQEELSNSINSLLESQKTLLGIDSYLADLICTYIEDKRDLSEFTAFQEKVKALKLNEVNNALRKYFNKSKLVLVYAGDFDKKP